MVFFAKSLTIFFLHSADDEILITIQFFWFSRMMWPFNLGIFDLKKPL